MIVTASPAAILFVLENVQFTRLLILYLTSSPSASVTPEKCTVTDCPAYPVVGTSWTSLEIFGGLLAMMLTLRVPYRDKLPDAVSAYVVTTITSPTAPVKDTSPVAVAFVVVGVVTGTRMNVSSSVWLPT